ncbi:MAG TPA: hypothetical protein VMI52_13870 [Acetobacteraceae bacterium]|nr:hypothetical protein [Acetobacteraceae bacterium]
MAGTGMLRAVIILACGVAAISAASAQPRNGNEQNGFDYQPTQGEVGLRERAAGVAPSTEHERTLDKEMEQINRDLLREEGLSPGNPAQGGPPR